MINFMERAQRKGRMRHLCVTAMFGLLFAAAGCDSLLNVDLPAQLGDDALEDPAGAEAQMATVIGHFESGYDLTTWEFHGREDAGEIQLASPGTNAGDMAYASPAVWFIDFMTSRRFAAFLHDKLESEWTVQQVPQRAKYLAISSIYQGAALNVVGSSLCEVAVDAGPLMTPNEALTMAEGLLTQALGEIASAGGDFEMPFGIASSAKTMTYGLRAQVRWMKGDQAGALADAQQVPEGFMAWVTRDGSPSRRNKAYWAGTEQRYAELYEVNTWWNPGDRTNPVTGGQWPQALPFTGYPYLGILPDGRAVRDNGLPIRVPGGRGEFRTPIENTAVPDTRVPFTISVINGVGFEKPVHHKYDALESDIPMVNWKEMVLIRAEIQGGQAAIDLVNQMRAYDHLPLVTYADPNNAEQIRYMIVEERRRALFLEGRFFMTKLRNTDILWFPRGRGTHPGAGRNLQGGVRFLMPDSEFELNEQLNGLSDRATGCAADQAPLIEL